MQFLVSILSSFCKVKMATNLILDYLLGTHSHPRSIVYFFVVEHYDFRHTEEQKMTFRFEESLHGNIFGKWLSIQESHSIGIAKSMSRKSRKIWLYENNDSCRPSKIVLDYTRRRFELCYLKWCPKLYWNLRHYWKRRNTGKIQCFQNSLIAS